MQQSFFNYMQVQSGQDRCSKMLRFLFVKLNAEPHLYDEIVRDYKCLSDEQIRYQFYLK